MLIFEIVIALLLCGAALSYAAPKVGAPYPALVALAGALLAIVPGTPSLVLDPQLALALFLAPVLVDSAFDASPRDLRAYWQPIAGLAFGAVALTVVAVAAVTRFFMPDMGWAAAITLGAIVAPPDAAAAIAVLNQVRPPHRILTILQGESLFNDASALLIYRVAAGAAVTHGFFSWKVVPLSLAITAGSIVFALAASRLTIAFVPRIREVSTSIIVQFCMTFAIWLAAERLHLSGILTTVVYAMSMSRRASAIMPARIRIPSYAVWEVTVFVLNVLAFILIGFQLKSIIAKFERTQLLHYILIAGVIGVAAVLARMAWVMAVAAWSAWRCRTCHDDSRKLSETVALPPRAAALVGWCGMRGIVTLAAALALPAGGSGAPAFPHRDFILFTSFAVVLGTLVAQGLTLRPILLHMQLDDDGLVDREVRLARVETLGAALAITSSYNGTDAIEAIRLRYDVELRRAYSDRELNAGNSQVEDAEQRISPTPDEGGLIRAAIAAERERLHVLRADGTIGDAAFQRIEQELDWREIDLLQFVRADSV